MKAINIFAPLMIMFTVSVIHVSAAAQKDPGTIDWSKVKETKSATLDGLTIQVKLLYDKVFLLEAVAVQIETQLNGTAANNDIDLLIEQIEYFTNQTDSLGALGGILLETASDDKFLEKVKSELSVVKYLRAAKNTATLIKAARIITQKTAGMITRIVPLKEKAIALKKAKPEKETTSNTNRR